MTEAEWLECNDPKPMLDLVRGKASDRNLRLFAVGCCRREWSLLTDERSQKAVEVAEQYTDELTSQEVLDAMRAAAGEAWGAGATPAARIAAWGAAEATQKNPAKAAARIVARDTSGAVQANLLRDIFANPFCPVTLDPSWLTPVVVALAQVAYDARLMPAGTLHPARLADLADALEKAGCSDPAIIAHCRGPGPHVRGCWVLDLLLGKQ